MVWARTKLMIHDDLLSPRSMMEVKFEGPNPERFYKEIPKLVRTIFKVTGHSMQEKLFEWKKTEPQKFLVKWEINKDLDKFSYYWIQIKLSGESEKGKGKATMSVEGALRTEYPQDTLFQRSLLYEFLRMFWHSTFYAPTRDRFIKQGRSLLSAFVSHVRELARI